MTQAHLTIRRPLIKLISIFQGSSCDKVNYTRSVIDTNITILGKTNGRRLYRLNTTSRIKNNICWIILQYIVPKFITIYPVLHKRNKRKINSFLEEKQTNDHKASIKT